MRGLKDRTVLVTGGANGIGAAIARRLAEEGCAVGILDLDATAGEKLAGDITAAGGRASLDALDITRSATPNIVVRNAIAEVRESVKEGETINEPLLRSGVFDDIVVNMIKVGEETGELDKMLIKVADNYDEEVDVEVGSLVSVIEPLLILFMGGAVFIIVLGLFLPLMKLIQGVGQGGGM